ncbi:MAG: GNAT family N-acetyltransferase [Usitatibacteraceae bacterium]
MPTSANPKDAPAGSGDIRIRPIDPQSAEEIAIVAQRMRETLIEVEGEETGTALYTIDWLKDRVKWHLNPQMCTGQVFLSENAQGHITGHTIVRVEVDEAGNEFGLFSTTFVEPTFRKQAVASRLTVQGEEWMRAREMTLSATWTSATNTKLIRLYTKHGYQIDQRHTHEVTQTQMVRLAKRLLD